MLSEQSCAALRGTGIDWIKETMLAMGASTAIPGWLLVVGPAIIGAASALFGVGVTARTTRRGWRRDEEHEHRQWLRTQRTAVYAGVFDACDERLWEAARLREQDSAWSPERSWFQSVDVAVTKAKLLGAPRVADLAERVMVALAESRGRADWPVLNLLEETLDAARDDLGVGDALQVGHRSSIPSSALPQTNATTSSVRH